MPLSIRNSKTVQKVMCVELEGEVTRQDGIHSCHSLVELVHTLQ